MGKGYSKDFIRSMSRIIDILNTENPVLVLTDGCDIICTDCPNNINGRCKNHAKVNTIDKNCLAGYGLDFGTEIRWNDLKKLAYDKIILPEKLPKVCKDCSWQCKTNG
ncbi:MAG: DUF1284 domain-containing protein [Acutalibacteraceae bacterium]